MTDRADLPHDLAPPSSDTDSEHDPDRARLQWMHDRSGEVELLISGALLFGLFQIPGRMSAWWDGVNAVLTVDSVYLVFLLYFYVRIMVLTLIAAFTLHVAARAYWVGLIGLDSVFPEGVDWDEVKYGPLAKSVYRDRMPTLSKLARKADNFGSAIFSVAFWVITIFVFSIAFGTVFGGLSWLLTRTILPGVPAENILIAFAVLLGLLPGLAITIEKVMGDRLDPESRLAGVIKGVLRVYYRASGGALYLPIQFTLFSRIPKKVVWPAAIALFGGLVAVLVVGESNRQGARRYSPAELLPDRPGARAVALSHFADTRESANPSPYIQSDIIEGPYIRLTVPLLALQYVDRLRAACPDLGPMGTRGLTGTTATDTPPEEAAEAALLDCLGMVWTVTLDGAPVTAEWDYVWTTGRGPSAIVTYLPTAELKAGVHVIEVERSPAPDAQRGSMLTVPGDESETLESLGADDAVQDAQEAAVAGGEPPRARYFIRFRI